MSRWLETVTLTSYSKDAAMHRPEVRWWRIDTAMLNDRAVQTLPPNAFKQQFLATLEGQPTVFSAFVRGPYSRPTSDEWKKLRRQVFIRDDFTCGYCGVRGVALECDHVIPVSKGGSSDMGNLRAACRPCNRRKRAHTLDEWEGE